MEAAGAHFLQRVLTRQAGHDQVQQDQVDPGSGHQVRDGRIARLGVGDGEAFPFQDRLDQPALGRIIVDDKDHLGHLKTPPVPDAHLSGRGSFVTD